MLLVIIDDLEEPSDRLGLALNSFEHSYLYRSTFLISATYFGTVVGRCQSFQGIVVTVVEFDAYTTIGKSIVLRFFWYPTFCL